MPALKRLDLGHCQLRDIGLAHLLLALPTLRSLDALLLSSNGLSEHACIALFTALAGTNPTTPSLLAPPAASTTGAWLPRLPFSSSSSLAAAALVSPTPSNATSTASPPSAGGSTDNAMNGFHHKKKSVTHSLALPQPQQQPQHPSPSLLHHQQPQQQQPQPLLPALRLLDLCDNGVGDTGAAHLAAALAQRFIHILHSLSIDLRLNPLTQAAAEALVRAVHAFRERGGLGLSLNTRYVRYWGGGCA